MIERKEHPQEKHLSEDRVKIKIWKIVVDLKIEMEFKWSVSVEIKVLNSNRNLN